MTLCVCACVRVQAQSEQLTSLASDVALQRDAVARKKLSRERLRVENERSVYPPLLFVCVCVCVCDCLWRQAEGSAGLREQHRACP